MPLAFLIALGLRFLSVFKKVVFQKVIAEIANFFPTLDLRKYIFLYLNVLRDTDDDGDVVSIFI